MSDHGRAADAVDVLLGFTRVLRAAGLGMSRQRVHALLEAVDAVGPARAADVYWGGRLAACASPADLPRYDRSFAAWFGGTRLRSRHAPRAQEPVVRPMALPDGVADAEDAEDRPMTGGASATEVLRRRDVADLTAAERAQVDVLLARLSLPGELRRTRRRAPDRRGRIDRARTISTLLRHGGEPAALRRTRPTVAPRRVVLLVDVSGSMRPYADALLRFAHAAARPTRMAAEVFTVGTRLTRVTTELRQRDPDAALAAAAAAVPDYSGGTRLGAQLRRFLARWGRPGMARGAVVVIASDGWERGGVELLGWQMRQLSLLAHRVVWANPRKGREGFAPTAAGMAVALPFVDDFVAGHSLAALEHLAAVVRGAVRGPVPGRGVGRATSETVGEAPAHA